MVDKPEVVRTSLRVRDFVDIVRTPWALSSTTILLYCLAIFPTTVTTEFGRLDRPDFLVATGVGLVSTLISGALLFGVKLLVERSGTSRLTAVLAMLMALGVLRGLIMSALIAASGLESASFMASRIGLSAASTPLVLAVVALLVNRVTVARQQARATRRAIADATHARDVTVEQVSDAMTRLLETIDVTLRPAINQLVGRLAAGTSTRIELSSALEALAEEIVRPLSHSVASTNDENLPRGSIKREIDTPEPLTLRQHINPIFSALGIGLGGFNVMLDSMSAPAAISASVIAATSTFALLKVAQVLFGRFSPPLLGALGIVAVLHEVVWLPAHFINQSLIFPPDVVVNFALLGVFTTPILGMLNDLVVVGNHTIIRQLAVLDSNRVDMVLQQSEARRASSLQRRHIAHTLHSSVQSRLHAHSRLLRGGNGPVTETERSTTIELLESTFFLIADKRPLHVNAVDSLNALSEFWGGMCDVTLEIDGSIRQGLTLDTAAAEAVSLVTLEAVSNAIRHGHATKVAITIGHASPGAMRVTAINDGERLADSPEPGLGSTTFDELTAFWEITNSSDDSVEFTAVIAARGNSDASTSVTNNDNQ